MQTGQLLTQATKDRRLLNSTKLLNKLKHPKESNMLWFFSDEKNFCQDQAHNRQNHRWIAMCPDDVPRVMKTKFSNTVMVFGVISSNRDVMPPHIFEMGLRIILRSTCRSWRLWCYPGSSRWPGTGPGYDSKTVHLVMSPNAPLPGWRSTATTSNSRTNGLPVAWI